jgi:hypothetical protein
MAKKPQVNDLNEFFVGINNDVEIITQNSGFPYRQDKIYYANDRA